MHQYEPYSIENAYTDFVTDYYDLLCNVEDYFKDTSIETVLELVDDTTCKILWVETAKDRQQQEKCKDLMVSADNILTGTAMINRLASLPNFKSITNEHKETIIELFLSLQQAHNAAAKTVGHLASLAHVLNADQFSYLLKHSMRPLVQLQIPPWLCHPGKLHFAKENLSTDEMYEQKAVNVILPRPQDLKLDSIEQNMPQEH